MIKNPSQPSFGLPNYEATIWEYEPAGSNILNMTASDLDQVRTMNKGNNKHNIPLQSHVLSGLLLLRWNINVGELLS